MNKIKIVLVSNIYQILLYVFRSLAEINYVSIFIDLSIKCVLFILVLSMHSSVNFNILCFCSVSLFGRSFLFRRVGLMSHLSWAQCSKWTEFAKLGDPWASARSPERVLVAPTRGSSTGVRTNTIQGVKHKEVGDPLAAHRRYSRKKSPLKILRSSWPASECFSLWDRVLLTKRLNRNINRCFRDIVSEHLMNQRCLRSV